MYKDYVRGLQAFKNLLPEEARNSFTVYEARLMENLHREQLFGGNETTRSERSIIIDGLNQLASNYNIPYINELLYPSQTERKIKDAIQAKQPLPSEQTPTTKQPLKREPPIHTTPPELTIKLLTLIIPTAYYHHLDVQRFPLVKVLVDNTRPTCDDTTLTISTMIEGYSDTSKTSLRVAKGESREETLLPLLKASTIKTLNKTERATLHVTVKQNTPITMVLDEHTSHIRLLARNTALLGIREPDGTIKDLTTFLAAWVTPHLPQIEKMLRSAADDHTDGEFAGYSEGNAYPNIPDNVQAQAKAIFQALKNQTDIRYSDPFTSQGAEEDQITQRVRLPSQCLTNRLANCIEGSVLFASLLEAASIDPIIILVPDHAFVGWHINRNAEQCNFLEMTMIANNSFEAAQQDAQEQFDQAQRSDYFSRELFDPRGFARFIDVEVCRRKGIYSIE